MSYDLNDATIRYPTTTWSFNNLAGMTWGDFLNWNNYLNFNTKVDLGFILNPDNPSEYILSQKLYPFNVLQFFSSTGRQQVRLGIVTDTGVNCNYLSLQKPSIKLFDYTIEKPTLPKGCDFINYEPYTEIQVFVPFFGWTDLPVNEVMGKTLSCYISVDFNSGEGMLIFTVTYENTTRLLFTIVNQLGYDIPIGSTNSREVIANYYRQWINLGTSAVSAYAGLKGATRTTEGSKTVEVLRKTKGGTNRTYPLESSFSSTSHYQNPSNYLGAATKSVNDIIGGNNISGHVSRGNSNNVLNNMALTSNALILIKQPKLVHPDDNTYCHLYGYACVVSGKLLDFQNEENADISLFRFDDVELTQNPKATQDEMQLIYDALTGGFYL